MPSKDAGKIQEHEKKHDSTRAGFKILETPGFVKFLTFSFIKTQKMHSQVLEIDNKAVTSS